MSLDNPKCPECGSEMEKKRGRYGYFWGCKNFKTKGCKGTEDIQIIPLEYEHIDYKSFVKNNPNEYLLKLIEEGDFHIHAKGLKDVLNGDEIKKGMLYDSNISTRITTVFYNLRKTNQVFVMAKLAYWLYSIDGDMIGGTEYWLNIKPENEHRKESHIKNAFIKSLEHLPLSEKGYTFYSEEYHIGKCRTGFGGYFVDIVAKDDKSDELIFIEVKGLSTKGRKAMEQLITYVRYYNRIHVDNKIKKAYVVCKGYPMGIFDDDLDIDIGIIGYVIEGDKISFITWKLI